MIIWAESPPDRAEATGASVAAEPQQGSSRWNEEFVKFHILQNVTLFTLWWSFGNNESCHKEQKFSKSSLCRPGSLISMEIYLFWLNKFILFSFLVFPIDNDSKTVKSFLEYTKKMSTEDNEPFTMSSPEFSTLKELDKKIDKMMIKDPKGGYSCAFCNKKQKNRGHAKEHVEIHFEGLSFKCDSCKSIMKSRNSMRVHISRVCLWYNLEICDEEEEKEEEKVLKCD